MLHVGLAAGGGGRCKDDGRFPMGPWSEMGTPEEGAGRKGRGSHFGCANSATPVWPSSGDVKRVVGEKILVFRGDRWSRLEINPWD